LFIAHPEVKPLFAKIDMATQQKKLLNALILVVENLRNPESLGQVLSALGARHVGYGAIPNTILRLEKPYSQRLNSIFKQIGRLKSSKPG
jgi:hemoglobin-like flavoprotein